jgi:hypothetical protein
LLDRVGQVGKAYELVRQALSAWPDDYEVLFIAIMVAGRAGDKALALRCFEQAKALCPSDPELAKQLERGIGSAAEPRIPEPFTAVP